MEVKILIVLVIRFQWVQTGNIVPRPEKTLFNKALEKAVTDLNPIASEKGVKLDLKVDSSKKVIADENMISTVLRNLINNAIKFSFENSVVKYLCIWERQLFNYMCLRSRYWDLRKRFIRINYSWQ